MRVRMIVAISGGRGDGTPWPPPGEVLDVDDDEGRQLCAGRLAVPVPVEQRAAETAVVDDPAVESRGDSPKRSTPRKN